MHDFLLELAMALVTTIGMRFLQVCLITFSTECNHKREGEGVGSESRKYSLRNTWMVPKGLLAKILKQMFDKNGEIFSKVQKFRLNLNKIVQKNYF